jgi:hypothetical protein
LYAFLFIMYSLLAVSIWSSFICSF